MISPKKLVAEFIAPQFWWWSRGVATESFGFALFGGKLSINGVPSVAVWRRIVATAFAFGLTLIALVYASAPSRDATSTRRWTMGFITSAG